MSTNNNSQMDETIAFFVSAFEDVNVDDIRALIIANTDARGNTNTEAVMAGLESLSAPKIAAPEKKVRKTAAEAAASSGPLKMVLRPVMDGSHLGIIHVNAELLAAHATQKKTEAVKTCILCDRSGSMGSSFSRLMNTILPKFLRGLKIPHDEKIAVISFDHTIRTDYLTIAEMMSNRLTAGGRTFMAPGIVQVGREIMKNPDRPVRLLVLSDGELHDQEETCAASSNLAQELRGRVRINSQAVRFFTSSSQPDTRGLASVLALNTVTESKLIDLSAAQEDSVLVEALIDAMDNDGLDLQAELECDGDIMTHQPWETNPSKTIALKPGVNYIWFKKRPEDLKLKAGGPASPAIPVDFEVSDAPVSLQDVSGTLKPLMDSYVARLKVLKVVNSPATVEEMKKILEYFERFETFLQQGVVSLNDLAQNHDIRSRIEYFRQMAARRRASLFGLMCEVANDEKVAKLSAAQQADYLRQVDSNNRNAKSLAKRAIGSGLDFSATLHQEIRTMRSHIKELESIDDTHHQVSFYSMETTIGGIRALCSLDDETLDGMEATDLIQLANIVGCPTGSKKGEVPNIGNFTDPMTYRVDKILPGVFLSLSDLLVAHLQSKGKSLTPPGYPDMEIVNIIPVFDDPRIHRFLMKYAPSLLEYTASIGMRRVLAEVPHTYAYTLAAGAWKMIEVVNENPTEGNVNLLKSFALDFHLAIHGHFDYLLDHYADEKQDPKKSFFINNNGITNTMSTILQLVNPKMLKNPEKHARGIENMSRILRALYSFEVYQAARRQFNKAEARDEFIEQYLHKLLGIDIEKHATPLQPLFEVEPKPEDRKHYDQYSVDKDQFKDFKKATWYIDYLTLMPSALACVTKDDPHGYIKENFRPKSPEVICEALGISSGNEKESAAETLDRFVLANIVQGFLFPSKADRVDSDNKCMKIIDLATPEIQEDFLRSYVSAQYANNYRKDCVAKLKKEKKEIVIEIIKELLDAKTMKEYVNILVNGKKRGATFDVIKDSAHMGYMSLKNSLMNLSREVPLRLRKLAVLVLGHDEDDQAVFNQGNVVQKGLEEVEETFLNLGEKIQFEQLQLRYRQFLKHNYRDSGMPNRHTHCTDKPSYFALGYATLDEFAKAISEKEFKEYLSIHWQCCGVPQMQGRITRRSERKGLEPPPGAKILPRKGQNDDEDGEQN